MNFPSGISLKIWIPFALTISLFILAVAYYYPNQQEALLYSNTKEKIKQISSNVALGIELSLSAENYSGLKKTIDLARKSSDFEFIAIIEEGEKAESVYLVNPSDFDHVEILNKNDDKYIYEISTIESDFIDAYVLLAVSKQKIRNQVLRLNFPVYIFLIVLLLISLIIFFFFAENISKPIRKLIMVANKLEQEDYEVDIIRREGKDDVINLNNALFKLRDTLKSAKKRNEEFNRELEYKIELRTQDLQIVQEKLLKAQSIAGLSNFEFEITSRTWFFSSNITEILPNLTDYTFGYQQWLDLLEESSRNAFKIAWNSILTDKESFNLDLNIQFIGIESAIWVNLLGEIAVDLNGNVTHIIGTVQNITERKLTEQEITRLSLVATKTSNCVIITDVNQNITWVNDSTLKTTGYERDEIIGKTPKMFQSSKTDPAARDYIRKCINNLEEAKTEILNVDKNGNEYWLELNISPMIDNNNIHFGFLAVETDITERKQFEFKILEVNERLESILNEVNDVVWSCTYPKFNTMLITPSGSGLFEADLLRLHDEHMLWRDRVYPEDLPVFETIFELLDQQGHFDVKYRIMTENNALKWINNRGKVIVSENGEKSRVDGIMSDISEVQSSIEKQIQFIKMAPTAIAMLDHDLNYITYSNKWLEDYNLNKEQVSERPFFEVFYNLDEQWKSIFKNCLKGNKYANDESIFKLDNEQHLWLKWRINPWYSFGNKIGGLLIMTEDITKFKESKEEELRNILKLTRSQNNRLKNFAHIVSHNLRSHSGNIQSLLNFLIEDFPELENNEIAGMLHTSSDNLLETIAHLAEVAAMNVREDLDYVDIDLRQFIDKAIDNVGALALNADVKIINNIPTDLKIIGLPAYIDSIFLNFLTNAIKYSNPLINDSSVELNAKVLENHVHVTIADNGIGIDLKRHGSKLFGMYKTFHGNEDARGIGLFITKNQIEAMGGSIEVESKPQLGTTFTIILKKSH